MPPTDPHTPTLPSSPSSAPVSRRRRIIFIAISLATLAALAPCILRVEVRRAGHSLGALTFARGNLSISGWKVVSPTIPPLYKFDCDFAPALDPRLKLEWSNQSVDLELPFSLSLLALSALTLWLTRKPHSAAPGHCLCGYPLTTLPCCPECGRPATTPTHT